MFENKEIEIESPFNTAIGSQIIRYFVVIFYYIFTYVLTDMFSASSEENLIIEKKNLEFIETGSTSRRL